VAHPDVDVVFGDAVVVDEGGRFIAYRKAVLPLRPHVWVCHLPVFSCATFFRRSIIERRGLFFDSRLRDVADATWVLRVLEEDAHVAVLRRYTSAFTQTGKNMNFLPNAMREKRELRQSAPLWMRALRPLWVARHRLAKWQQGCYRQKPFQYAVYTLADPQERTTFTVTHPAWRLAINDGRSV